MAILGQQLAQSTPSDTNAASIYSPAKGIITEITQVLVTEVAGGTPTYRIFLDNDGTTYSTATALFYDNAMAASTTEALLQAGESWWMTNSSGNLAVRSSVGSQLTFTVFGIEHQP